MLKDIVTIYKYSNRFKNIPKDFPNIGHHEYSKIFNDMGGYPAGSTCCSMICEDV